MGIKKWKIGPTLWWHKVTPRHLEILRRDVCQCVGAQNSGPWCRPNICYFKTALSRSFEGFNDIVLLKTPLTFCTINISLMIPFGTILFNLIHQIFQESFELEDIFWLKSLVKLE